MIRRHGQEKRIKELRLPHVCLKFFLSTFPHRSFLQLTGTVSYYILLNPVSDHGADTLVARYIALRSGLQLLVQLHLLGVHWRASFRCRTFAPRFPSTIRLVGEMELTCLARSVCSASELSLLGRTRQHHLAPKLQPRTAVRSGDLPAPSAFQQSAKPESKRARRPENVDGEFYVDRTCIDCDTCRWMAPTVFKNTHPQSAVYHQPESPEERLQALQALLSCPTSSIHTERPPKDIKDVHNSFPIPVDADEIPGVYHCGYHSEASFAATSYFITRPDGNILVDSPRYSEVLAKNMEAMGGVRYMFLTHKDDIADHKRWQARFNCERILHELEVQPKTQDVELKLQGEGPWTLGSDIDLIFTPGHTRGHVCLLYKKGKGVLFSGDHLGGIESSGLELSANTAFNWYSVPIQLESVEKLLPLEFTWILPGHGRRRHYSSLEERDEFIKRRLGSAPAKYSN